MRKLLAVTLWIGVGLGLGCTGDNPSLQGSDDEASDPVICTGDPDGEVVCKKSSEFWDCSQLPNGENKCGFAIPQQPGGQSSWSCKQVDNKVVCTTNTPNAQPSGAAAWTCTSSETSTTCEKEGPVPTGAGDWECTLSEFSWTCVGTDLPGSGTSDTSGTSGSGTSGSGTNGSGTNGGSTNGSGTSGSGTSGNGTNGSGTNGGSTGPLVCTHWYAAKWGIGGSTAASCEGIPNNSQDCDGIRNVLSAGLPGPLTNGGSCTVEPTRVGANWVLTLPSSCEFVDGAVCGKFGGNTFLTANGTTTVLMPAQQATGLSHFEAMWCCR